MTPTDRDHESGAQCEDDADNDGDGFVDCDDLDCRSEDGACRFAAEADRSLVSNLFETSRFLYTGPDPVQKDLDQEQLDFWRVSLIHGRVVDSSGEALRGVRVGVKGRPELGYSETRRDGRYDLVVNGGGVHVLDYQLVDHIGAQRSVATEWQREHVVPDVGLIALSSEVHTLRLGEGRAVRGALVRDAYGNRQPFLVFPAWVEAEAVLESGDREPLDELHLRLTSYPFEPAPTPTPGNSARFSPGSLRSAGALSHSLDVNVEEAHRLGATRVEFSEPIAYYVDNFLGLPAGSSVPLHSYDASVSEWERMGDGIVVEVIDIQAGLAQLDSDGDGEADSADVLDELGVSRAEREELGARFEPGDTLLRNQVDHFSTLTQIWDVVSGGTPAPADLPFQLKSAVDHPLLRGNIMVEDRALREMVDLVGTPFSLVYQGNRSNGHSAAFRVKVPVVGETVPAGLTDVFVVAEIGGRLFPQDPEQRRLDPEPGLEHEFIWDGKNSSGQLLQGEQTAKVWIGYAFEGASLTGVEALTPEEVREALPFPLPGNVIWSWQDVLLGMLDTQGFQFGGFGLSVHHAFDPVRNILYYGDGRQRTADGLDLQIIAIDQSAEAGDGALGEAVRRLEAPDSMAVNDDGSVFVSDDGEQGRIWRISPAGDKEVVLGPGAPGEAGEVELLGPQGLALDPTDGTLFVTAWEALQVLFLRPSGEVGILLGDDPEALIQEPLTDPDGLAVGPNRELYVADANRVLKLNVSANQIDDPRYLGGVEPGSQGEVLPVMLAEDVPLEQASGLAVDLATGTLYVASRFTHQVWRVEPNGEAFLVAGTGEPGFSGDGDLAVDAQLEGPRGVALGNDGSLFISDQENFRIRRVFPSGEITTVAGGGDDFPSSITPGPNALVNRPDGLAFGPDGSLFAGGGAVDTEPPHLFRLSPGLTGVIGATNLIVPSDDGLEAYRFDQNGRHLETIDVVTGATRLTFEYDDDNLLTRIIDTFDVTTDIERDGDGRATQLRGPFGHEVDFEYDAQGFLKSLSASHDGSQAFELASFEYDGETGLLSVLERGAGDRSSFTFDRLGRIASATDALGIVEEYSSASTATAQRIDVRLRGADDADVYERLTPGVTERDGFSFNDRDSYAFSGSLGAGSFSSALAGGASVTGVEAPSAQWGEQVRLPSEITLSTADGKSVTQSFFVTVNGLSSTGTGAIANPLDFDSYEVRVSVNDALYRRTYDRDTRTLSAVSPAGRTVSVRFNEQGLPERISVPGLAEKSIEYDAMGRIATVRMEADGETRVTSYAYGDDGLLETLTDPLGQSVSVERDELGRAIRILRNDGGVTRLDYDDKGNVISVAPPDRADHAYVYDAGVRLGEYRPPAVDQAAGSLPAGQVQYSYDDFSRPSAVTLADGSSIENHYFQDFYRPSQMWITPSAGQDEDVYYLTYHDTNPNLLESIYGPENGVLFEHDPPLVSRVEFQTRSASGIINVDHDEFLRPSEIHLVGSNPVEYQYDDDSLLSRAGPIGILRNPDNDLILGTLVGSVSTTEASNGFGELEGYSVTFDGDTLFSQNFERDALGRVRRIVESNQGVTTDISYGYDDAGRLESATIDGISTSYFYDSNGNRLGETGSDASYDAQDRIQTFAEWEFEASPSGDITRRTNSDQSDGYELIYEPRGALVRATVVATGDAVTYEVDPFGRRIGRRVNGGARKGWLYSEGLSIVAEIDDNAARTDFIYGSRSHVPDLMFKYGTTFYRLVTDHLGSVRLVVDVETGEVVQELAYDPWGKVVLDTNPGFQPFGFAGGLYDPATGLVRFGARDYDPEVGRWTTKDPLGLSGDINVYLYARGDPINFVDPNGHAGIYINYVNYPVRTGWGFRVPLFHAAVIAVNPETGHTEYYEYGRYPDPVTGKESLRGFVRRKSAPNLKMVDGKPTEASMKHLMATISVKYGHGVPVEAWYYEEADEQKIIEFARGRMNDENRDDYSLYFNNCGHFAQDAMSAGAGFWRWADTYYRYEKGVDFWVW